MRAVVQRVTQACVEVDNAVVGQIDVGLLVLLGVEQGDQTEDLEYLVNKVAGLRIFEDADGKMNRSVQEVGGSALVVSQFTLLGDCRKGRRPSFVDAAPPEQGNEMYEEFCRRLGELQIPIQKGQFRAHMNVSLVNSGPVTLILDSRKRF